MIRSMTGFGKTVLDTPEASVTVEIKTLNSKYFDTYIKIGNVFFDKEIELKNILSERLERGKVNMMVNYSPKRAEANKVTVNYPLVKSYFEELSKTADSLQAPKQDIFRMTMLMPDTYLKEFDEETQKEDWKLVLQAVDQAITKCEEFRLSEGKSLQSKLQSYVESIQSMLEKVNQRDPERVAMIRERLQKQVSDFVNSENFDPNRFEQELIYYIEKLDISEEKVRLKKHLEYFHETLKGQKSSGKKLGFIAQEIGREINTIGAKANDASIQRLVVNMKEELEKIKEQVLNVV